MEVLCWRDIFLSEGGGVKFDETDDNTPTNLRLPDLRRNRKMVSLSYRFHVFCAKDEYVFCHNLYVSDDASGEESTTPDHGISFH